MPNSTVFSRKYYVFLIIFLGMLSAFGPFVTDMYLPTLPAMAEIFRTSPSMVQLGLATSMLGLAVGQIFFGPLSDKYGRRHILMAAMILFSISTIISIYSPTIEFFNVCRFVQGLGGAGGIVLSRSISTDCYSGRELAKTLAIIGAVNGIAPVTAPVVGGMISEAVGWQGIFWILFAIGILLLGMNVIFRESLPAESYHKGSVLNLMSSFPKILRLRYFRIYVLMFAFANGVLFSYISSASFIIQNYFGFSEMVFAVIFGINALGIGIGSTLSLKFRTMKRAAIFGTTVITVASILELAGYFLFDNFWIFEILIFFLLTGLGYIFTAATTLAMDEGRSYIGAASAIFGATGFLFGGIVSPLAGLGNIMSNTLLIITLCSFISLIFAVVAYKRK